jgi:hypothetical protein
MLALFAIISLLALTGGAPLLIKSPSGPSSGTTPQHQIEQEGLTKPVVVNWNQQGWARTWTGNPVEGDYVPEVICKAVAVSRAGAIYVAGGFFGTIDFDPDPNVVVQANSDKGYDCFLSKFEPNGDFAWVRTWGSEYNEYANFRVNGRGVAADKFGNVYLTGDFMGTVDLDPDPSKELIFNSTGGEATDPFLCKLNPDGELLWAIDKSESESEEYGWNCKVDDSNNVLWTGYLVKEAHVQGSSQVNRTYLTFLAKYDSNGNLIWQRDLPESGGRDDTPAYVDIDSSGAAYVAGYFFNMADLSGGQDPAHYTIGYHGIYDIYLSKWSASGNFQWAKAWGNEEWDKCSGVAVDRAVGIVYVSGTVNRGASPVVFSGDQHLPGAAVDPEGGSAGYMVNFQCSTGALQNVQTIKGPGGCSCDGIAIDQNGNTFTMGTFTKTIDVGGEILTAVGTNSMYVARLSSLGGDLWTQVLTGDVDPSGIALDPSFGAYVVGDFHGTVDFAPVGLDNHSSAAQWAASFLVSYPESGSWGRLTMQNMDRMPLKIKQKP